MNKYNEINKIGLLLRKGGLDESYNGYPRDTYIEIAKKRGLWFMSVEHEFVNNKSTGKNITVVKTLKFLPMGEYLIDLISKLELDNLDESYMDDIPNAECMNMWGIIINNESVSMGHEHNQTESVKKFIKLINLDGIMKEINFMVMDELDNYDDKVLFAYINNLYDLDKGLSYDEKMAYIKEQIRLLDERNIEQLEDDNLPKGFSLTYLL